MRTKRFGTETGPRPRAWRRLLARSAATVGLVLVVAGVGLVVAAIVAPSAPAPHTPERLAIHDVDVVDVEAGSLRRSQTVLVDGGRIERIGPAAETAIPAGARRIDGRGLYLMPGLVDMHVHWGSAAAPQLTMPLMLAHGVTSVREMGGEPGFARKEAWRRGVEAGEILGPRTLGMTFAVIDEIDAEDVPDLVDRAAEGGGVLKVYNRLLADPYHALLAAARARGVEVVGHRPLALSLSEVVGAGQRSVEHARVFLYESFPGAADLRRRSAERFRGLPMDDGPLVDTALRRRMLDEHSPEEFRRLADAMALAGTGYVPTHVTRRMDAMADDRSYRQDERLRYIHFAQELLWHEDADGMVARDPSPEGRRVFMEFYRRGLELTGEAHRAGVEVLAGTDANDTYVFPGSAMHDELGELVKAGLSPAEALRAATVGPARFLDRDDLGVIDEGAVADLVLLGGDPLSDIEAVRDIRAVVHGGALYGRADLDRLLAGVEQATSSVGLLVRTVWYAVTAGAEGPSD